MGELIGAFALVASLGKPAEVGNLVAARPALQRGKPIAATPPESPLTRAIRQDPSQLSSESRNRYLTSLYASFVTLEALDVHSTLRAVNAGAHEANPAMRGIVGNPAAFIAVKAAAGVTAIWMSEKVRKKHPRAALVLMAALNSAVAAVVAHNYAIR